MGKSNRDLGGQDARPEKLKKLAEKKVGRRTDAQTQAVKGDLKKLRHEQQVNEIEQEVQNEQHEKLASFPAINPNPVVEATLSGQINFVNPAARRLFCDLVKKGSAHPYLADWKSAVAEFRKDKTKSLVREITVGDVHYQQSMHFVEETQCVCIYGIDITERREKEEELHRLNRTLRALSKSSQAMTRWQEDEKAYLDTVCSIIIEDCGHQMVWIGYAQDDDAKTVKPEAYWGFEAGYLETLKVTWADTERGRGPTGTAIRTGKVSMCKNMLTDPSFKPWRKEAIKRGYASSIVFPLKDVYKTFGALTIYSKQPDPFSEDEVKLLTELANDLSYGITMIRLREAQKQAEEKLRESEERFRVAQELSPDGFAILRPVRDSEGRVVDFTFVYENAAIARINGTDPATVVGRRISEFLPAHSQSPFHEAHAHVADTGETCIMERKYDGGDIPRPTWFRVVVVRTGQDIAILSQDITERKKAEEAQRKRAEEALRMSEEEFRSLAEAMPQIVWATRPDGWNIYFNQQWVDYTGMTMEESYGHGWNKPFHPDDKQRAWDAWQRATQYKEHYSLECRLRRADGVYRWWLIRGEPMRGANGEILKWFGTCTDIEDIKQSEAAMQEANDLLEQRVTERTAELRQSERLYRAIGESIDYGIWVCAPDGRNTYASESFLKMVGITQQQCSDFGWGDVLHPDDSAATIAAWQECVRTGKPWNREHRFRGVDGQWHHVLARGVPVRDERGQIISWAGINLDIGDLKQAEETLRQNREDLNRAQVVAHIGSWRLDVRRNELTWSDENHRIFGIPKGTPLTYETFLSTIHPDDREYVDTRWKAGLAGEDYDIEHRIVVNGTVKWVREKAYLEFDANNELIGGFRHHAGYHGTQANGECPQILSGVRQPWFERGFLPIACSLSGPEPWHGLCLHRPAGRRFAGCRDIGHLL